jgi:hypothetical protein
MRRSTVLSLPPHLVFLAQAHSNQARRSADAFVKTDTTFVTKVENIFLEILTIFYKNG